MRDSKVDNNDIVTVNINRQRVVNTHVSNIENMMNTQVDASLSSMFNKGSPYKHMPDILKK